MSNIDELLAAVNEGLRVLSMQIVAVNETPHFEMMQEHLEGAKAALEDIANSSMAMQDETATQELLNMADAANKSGKSLQDADALLRAWMSGNGQASKAA